MRNLTLLYSNLQNRIHSSGRILLTGSRSFARGFAAGRSRLDSRHRLLGALSLVAVLATGIDAASLTEDYLADARSMHDCSAWLKDEIYKRFAAGDSSVSGLKIPASLLFFTTRSLQRDFEGATDLPRNLNFQLDRVKKSMDSFAAPMAQVSQDADLMRYWLTLANSYESARARFEGRAPVPTSSAVGSTPSASDSVRNQLLPTMSQSPAPTYQPPAPTYQPLAPSMGRTTAGPAGAYDLTTPRELSYAADDLKYLAGELQRGLETETRARSQMRLMAIEDAGAFSQASGIFAGEFDTYRTDPGRFQKLVAALGQFEQLLKERLTDLKLTGPTQNSWTQIQRIIAGLQKRVPTLTGY